MNKLLVNRVALLCTLMMFGALAAYAGNSGEQQIRDVLAAQVSAWNKGDLEGFMQGYWKSPQLVFQSGANATHGWQPTLERYRKRYQSEGKEMGHLDFENLEVIMLAKGAAFVRGGYRLTMKDGTQPHGLFTLVLRRLPEGWRIVHDHTCAAE
jgi:beta-aspartyl-peptidase (threonine type)